MDSHGFIDNVQVEKANALARYNRFNNISKLLRLIEVFIAVALISWSSTRLPTVFNVSGEYFYACSSYMLNQHVVFLVGNVIVVICYMLSGHTDVGNVTVTAGSEIAEDKYKSTETGSNIEPVIPSPLELPVSEQTAVEKNHDKAVRCEKTYLKTEPEVMAETSIKQATKQIERFQRTQSVKLRREKTPKPRGELSGYRKMSGADFFFLPPLILLLIFLKLIVRPRSVKIPIKSRHVFITGGSGGIGVALARRAAAEGARVTILARNVEKLQEAKASIRASTGVDVAIVSADVRDYDAVKKVVESVGPIDVLICNQGVFSPYEVVNQEMKVIEEIIGVNMIGCFSLVKAALPGMKSRSDRRPVSIAFMSSQSGQVGIYGYTPYAASKFGLRGLAEALQQEVIADDIHVSLIFPPDTDTPSLTEENKKRPPLTSIIAAHSGVMNVDEVAKKTLDGIKSGSFYVHCNFLGFLMAIETAGLSPQRSYLMAFVEVISIGVLRIVALCYQWTWYRSIEKWHAKRKSA